MRRPRPLGASLTLALASVSLVVALAACGDGPQAVTRVPVASVVVVAPPATLLVGVSQQLVATPRAADDAVLVDRPVTWSSESEDIATVSPTGLLTARAPGTVWLRATSEGRTARVAVQVVAPPPAAVPTVSALEPAAILAGTAEPVTVRVVGTGFAAGTTARWNGADRTTVVESETVLRVTLPAADLAEPAVAAITVHAPGGSSAAATLRVEAAPAPAPTVTALEPASVLAGPAEPLVVTVRGTGFTPRSRVLWKGTAREAQYVGAGELRLTLAAADLATAGEHTVAVTTDAPGGGRAEARLAVLARTASILLDSPTGSEWTWPGLPLLFEARPLDAAGRPIDLRVVQWQVSDASLAELASGGSRTAIVFGSRPGQGWIEAMLDGVTARRALSVHAAPAFDLVYATGTGDARGLALWSPQAGGIPVRLPIALVASDPAPSPDGRLIAFTGAVRGGGVDANHDIYVVHRDGSGLRRLTTDAAYDALPAWSPDGTRLAFTSNREGHGDVYTMAPDGSDVRRLTEARVADPLPGSGNSAGGPAWSPDGTHLAYVVGLNGRSTLWIMRADGSGKRALGADAAFDDYHPAWADGQRIAFRRVRRATQQEQLVTLDAATGTNLGWWMDLTASGVPTFTPDGRWLALSGTDGSAAEPLRVRPLFEHGGSARVVLPPTEPGGLRQARWIRRP